MSDTRAAMREFRFLEDKRQAEGLSPEEEQRWIELRQALGAEPYPAQQPPQVPGYYAADGNWYPYAPGYFPAPGGYPPAYPPPAGYAPYPLDAYGNPMPYGSYDPNYPAANPAPPAGATSEAAQPILDGQGGGDPTQVNYANPNPYSAYPSPQYSSPPQYYPYDPQPGAYYYPEQQSVPQDEVPSEPAIMEPADPQTSPEAGEAQTAIGAPEEPMEIDPSEIIEVPIAPLAHPAAEEPTPTAQVAPRPELMGTAEKNGAARSEDFEPISSALPPQAYRISDPAREFADAPVVSDDIALSHPPIAEAKPAFETTLPDLLIPAESPESPSGPSQPLPEIRFDPLPAAPFPEVFPAHETGPGSPGHPPGISVDPAVGPELFGDPIQPDELVPADPLELPPEPSSDVIELAPAAEFVHAATSTDPAFAERPAIEWSPQPEGDSEQMEVVHLEDERAGQMSAAPPSETFEIAPAAEFMTDAAAVNNAAQFGNGLPLPASDADLPEIYLEPSPASQSPRKSAGTNGAIPLARISMRSVPASEAGPAAVAPAPRIPPPAATVSTFVQGEHRVILHTVEGHVKRGVVRDIDFRKDVVSLEQPNRAPPEQIPAARLKAVFFMASPGGPPPQPKGQKIRVTFNDGRQVAGYSEDFNGNQAGFFLVPSDTRTNTSRIYVFRASVQTIAAG